MNGKRRRRTKYRNEGGRDDSRRSRGGDLGENVEVDGSELGRVLPAGSNLSLKVEERELVGGGGEDGLRDRGSHELGGGSSNSRGSGSRRSSLGSGEVLDDLSV